MTIYVLTALILFIGALYCAYLGYLYANQAKLVFDPNKNEHSFHPENSEEIKTRAIRLCPEPGLELEGWITRPTNISEEKKIPATIYFGGRGEDVGWLGGYAYKMHPGAAVVYINYRGYGQSKGIPSERKLIKDALFIFDWLLEKPYIDGLNINVIGRSLGTGVAVQLSKHRAVRKMVLITPYDSLERIAQSRIKLAPVRLLLSNKFDSAEAAKYVACPTLVLLADEDDIVPHQRTHALLDRFEVMPEVKIIKGTNHLNIPHLLRTQKVVGDFLNESV